ncbi:MAG: PilT/PilU family type 4a pilus ATPase [Candidatus Eremiobacteraeota bacterium]|nr:PilT/PilU family type 4a pilus ATPase [Candidatus Eremiobacteraeota bacterium]
MSAGRPPGFRVDGELQQQSVPPVEAEELTAIADAVLDERSKAQLEGDGDATLTAFGDDGYGPARVHLFRAQAGICVVIRLLNDRPPALEALGLPPVVASFGVRQNGLILFAGPTGAGKTTAAASLLQSINGSCPRHILTIEDPIEYRHVSQRSIVEQRQIGRDVRSFADAIVGALRSDADVLLVGEMRDRATMRAAIGAAETGHLVLATLHTATAAHTIDRIVGAFAGSEQNEIRSQLAQSLLAIVCLRLIPCIKGGRTAACEILIATDGVRALVRDGKTHNLRNVILTSGQLGMQTLEAHLDVLVRSGVIAQSTAMSYAQRGDQIRSA